MVPENNLTYLANLIDKVKTYNINNEANTKSNIITPILSALNWNVNSSFEVVREYPLADGGRVDYALRVVDDIKVLIEAKKMTENLSIYENQIRKYAADNKHINLFVLSNGIQWQFYTWLKGIVLFLFMDIDINIIDAKRIAHELYFILSKDNITSKLSDNYIKDKIANDPFNVALYNAIIEVWHNILERPSPQLCDLIMDTVKNEFNMLATDNDVKKILEEYHKEFIKIRGNIKVKSGPYGGSLLEEKTRNDLRKIIKNMSSFHNNKKAEWIERQNLNRRLSSWCNVKTLNLYIKLLEDRGIIKRNGDKLKLIGEFKDYL